jgi:hypothetical protein
MLAFNDNLYFLWDNEAIYQMAVCLPAIIEVTTRKPYHHSSVYMALLHSANILKAEITEIGRRKKCNIPFPFLSSYTKSAIWSESKKYFMVVVRHRSFVKSFSS